MHQSFGKNWYCFKTCLIWCTHLPKLSFHPQNSAKTQCFQSILLYNATFQKEIISLQTVTPPSKHQNTMSVLTSWRAAVEADWRALEAAPKELRSERQAKLRKLTRKLSSLVPTRKWWGLDVGWIIVYRIMLDAYLRRMHGLLFNEILRWHVQAL